MAKKKKSGNNKVLPVLVLSAILGGGYYLLTHDDTSDKKITNSNESLFDVVVNTITGNGKTDSNGSTDGGENADDTLNTNQTQATDTSNAAANSSETSGTNVSNNSHPTTKQPSATTKYAYVDEYGNTIYTQPNGVAPITYKIAKMGRWGYSIKYPSFLTTIHHNSDGSTFEDGRGIKLMTYASWNVFNETITELYHKDIPELQSVTYKKLLRRQNAYVKSGYTKSNKVYYLKEVIFKRDGQEEVASLIFIFPKTYQKEADKIIKEVFSSFPLR